MIYLIIALAAGAGIGLFFYFRSRRYYYLPGIYKIPDGTVKVDKSHTRRSPKGITFYSRDNNITDEHLRLADQAADEVFADARLDGYSNGLHHGGYTIYFPTERCAPSPEQRIPSMVFRGDAYDGSVFDQYNTKGRGVKDGIGVVLASEYTMGIGTARSPAAALICPDMTHFKNGVRYFLEHCLHAQNNVNRFSRSFTHTVIPHPTIPWQWGDAVVEGPVPDGPCYCFTK